MDVALSVPLNSYVIHCEGFGSSVRYLRNSHMSDVRWEYYPLVAQHELARTWLQVQANLQLRPKTIDAYGRSLNDYLAFCARHDIVPEAVTRDLVALYVQDLAHRPNPKRAKILSIES